MLAAVVGVALAGATDGRAADTGCAAWEVREVVSLSVVPITGRAEVVIAVDGSVKVQDFTLSKPARVVARSEGRASHHARAAVRQGCAGRDHEPSRLAV